MADFNRIVAAADVELRFIGIVENYTIIARAALETEIFAVRYRVALKPFPGADFDGIIAVARVDRDVVDAVLRVHADIIIARAGLD